MTDLTIAASKAAWEIEMMGDCSCESYETCTCERTEDFKETANTIRKHVKDDDWNNPSLDVTNKNEVDRA